MMILSALTPQRGIAVMTITSPTFVLVPGAWQGGWAWQPVARRLREADCVAVTITLPGLADGDERAGLRLADAVDHVVAEVTRRDLSEVVLVGQSWGGYVITGAAHGLAGRLAKVIYYNAVVPARGTAMVDENAEYAAMTRAAIEASPDGTISVAREQVPMLMPEADKQAQDLFFELLVPQPGGYFLDPIDVGDVTTLGVPAGYILSEDDRALARPGTEFAARIGLTPVMVSGGHESMLTRPDEVTKALLKI
jgi:pimeloyl-ACP methyl ester carboxylesterase